MPLFQAVSSSQKGRVMHSFRAFALIVGMLSLNAPQSLAQETCIPALTIKEARISEVSHLQRTWTGVLAVDAARCATASGAFQIAFTRLKEFGPDTSFTERFSWGEGQTEVSLDIWWDEWLQDARIVDIAPCPCPARESR
jgi:hypothetical protein